MKAKKKTGRVAVSVRFTPAMYARLKALAERTQRSISWHVVRTMEDELDAIEREVDAILKGMADSRAGRGRDAREVVAEMRAKVAAAGAVLARKAG